MLHGSNAFIRKSARIDQVKVVQIGKHVQGYAVHRDVTRCIHAYGTYLASAEPVCINPHTGGTFQPFAADAVHQKSINYALLQ